MGSVVGPGRGVHQGPSPSAIHGHCLADGRRPNPLGGAGVSPADLLLDPVRTIQSKTIDCPNPVGVAIGSRTGKVVKLPCNRWSCPECGPVKVKRLQVRTLLGDLQPRAFLTLTQHTDDQTPITDAWNRFVSALRSKGWIIRYIWVKEYTRKGKTHLHVLVEGWWDWTETSRLWMLATGGASKITNIKKIHDFRGAVRYIMKYLSKTLNGIYEKGERRYSSSRGAILPPVHSVERYHVFIYGAGAGRVGWGDSARRIEGIDHWINAVVRDLRRTIDPLDRLRRLAPDQTYICS